MLMRQQRVTLYLSYSVSSNKMLAIRREIIISMAITKHFLNGAVYHELLMRASGRRGSTAHHFIVTNYSFSFHLLDKIVQRIDIEDARCNKKFIQYCSVLFILIFSSKMS